MFFIISKILAFLFKPLTWIIGLLILSLVSKNLKRKKTFLIIGFTTLLFFSNEFIANEFMRIWEKPMIEDCQLKENYDVCVVLGGGMIDYDAQFTRSIFRNNTDRILQAVRLYKEGRVNNILISSGSGDIIYRDIIESSLLKSYLCLAFDMPDSVIYIDTISENTYQNAVYSSILLKEKFPDKNYLLITSASHMRRSLACFNAQGINLDYYVTDKNAGQRRCDVFILLFPSSEAFQLWDELFHEWIGYITYFVYGYL